MADLTFSQLETLWIQAGGSKAAAPIMAAIALAESSGNPAALNPNDNGGKQSSYGLWQISDGTHSPPSENWQNPRVNAALAVAKYQAGGLGPWGTYPQPALTILAQHGGQAPAALPGTIQGAQAGSTSAAGSAAGSGGGFHFPNPLDLITGPASIVESLGGIAGSFSNIADTFGSVLNHIEWFFQPSHWVRIIAGLFGTGTLITGVWALSRTGSGAGDVSLAMGIGLVTFAGILLFVAFHNLDSSVDSLPKLLGAFSKSVTSGDSLSSETAPLT